LLAKHVSRRRLVWSGIYYPVWYIKKYGLSELVLKGLHIPKIAFEKVPKLVKKWKQRRDAVEALGLLLSTKTPSPTDLDMVQTTEDSCMKDNYIPRGRGLSRFSGEMGWSFWQKTSEDAEENWMTFQPEKEAWTAQETSRIKRRRSIGMIEEVDLDLDDVDIDGEDSTNGGTAPGSVSATAHRPDESDESDYWPCHYTDCDKKMKLTQKCPRYKSNNMPNYNVIWSGSLNEVKGIRRHLKMHEEIPKYPKFIQPTRAPKVSRAEKARIAAAKPGLGTYKQQHDADPNRQLAKYRKMAENKFPIFPEQSLEPLAHVLIALNIPDDDDAAKELTNWAKHIAFLSQDALKRRTMAHHLHKANLAQQWFDQFAARIPTYSDYLSQVAEYEPKYDRHQALLLWTALIAAGRNNRILVDFLADMDGDDLNKKWYDLNNVWHAWLINSIMMGEYRLKYPEPAEADTPPDSESVAMHTETSKQQPRKPTVAMRKSAVHKDADENAAKTGMVATRSRHQSKLPFAVAKPPISRGQDHVAMRKTKTTKAVHSDVVAMNKTETTKPVHSDGVAMRKTKTTKAVHSDVVAPSTPARVVKEEPMGRETPASARGVLVCSFSSAEERIVYSKNFLFDDSESLEDKQRLRVACLQDAERLFGQTSSEPAQLLMIAATANRIPFVGLRLWHFEDQVLQTYIRQLIKNRDNHVEELAYAQQHKTGWKFVKPTTDYLYNDIGELIASIEPAVVDLTSL
jgi:hypothetical protein